MEKHRNTSNLKHRKANKLNKKFVNQLLNPIFNLSEMDLDGYVCIFKHKKFPHYLYNTLG